MRLTISFLARTLLSALLLTQLAAVQLSAIQVPAAPGTAGAPASPAPSATTPQTPAPEEISDDPLGRATPRGTVLGFWKAASTGDYDLAAQFLDTKQHGELAHTLASQLKEILDRGTAIDITRLSRRPEGSQAIPQQPNRELIGVTTPATGQISIYLDRVRQGDAPPIWLFSPETLQKIPEAYESLSGPSTLERKLPAWLQAQWLGTPVWRWLILIALIPVILYLGSWINRLIRSALRNLARRIAGEAAVTHVRTIRAPLRLLLLGIVLLIFAATAATLLSRTFWHNVGMLVTVIALTWLASRTVGLISELAVARLKRLQSTERIALTGLIGKLSQIIAIIIGVLVILHMRGVNLTAALTGLGIGGIAIAFAAQRTIENLFGGIMIISDHPFRIGDFCRIGTVEGTILDIGLRSTTIRTLSRTIVTIPNGQLASMNVENFTFRDKFWFRNVVSLRYDTTTEQIQAVVSGIRKLLEEDPRVEPATFRVNFIAIGGVSDDIEIFAYVFAENMAGFLVVQESLLLRILQVVESTGTDFALPTQLTKLESRTPSPLTPDL
jgi:MscS family membrane protein